MDGTGAVVAEYAYDPYGNIISATGELAEINPLRYRGYVYDQECNLYYLQSRYYDPSIGRFLNADVFASTGQGVLGHNMFAYCNNNPVIYSDSTGRSLAIDMLREALEGDGAYKIYDENSKIAKKLKKSTAIHEELYKNIDMYRGSGCTYYYGTISTYKGDTLADKDLALSVGAARYSMIITRETRTIGFLYWRKEQVRYDVEIQVHDTYDFTEWRSDSSFGSIMNNIAYIGQIAGVVKPYGWQTKFTITTDWEDI